jgi:hypothetical protein
VSNYASQRQSLLAEILPEVCLPAGLVLLSSPDSAACLERSALEPAACLPAYGLSSCFLAVVPLAAVAGFNSLLPAYFACRDFWLYLQPEDEATDFDMGWLGECISLLCQTSGPPGLGPCTPAHSADALGMLCGGIAQRTCSAVQMLTSSQWP